MIPLRPSLAPLAVLLVATSCAAAPRVTPGAAPLVAVLCYHDVSDDPGAELQTVPARFLRAQIEACKQTGWTFLSLADLLERQRKGTLPPRSMVLTFDDGYRSFYDQALPVLESEHVPATIAIITSYTDHPPANLPPLMSWDQIRAAEHAGIEVASHTHDLHHYETDNPVHDTAPGVSARLWLDATKRYETREEYRSRIRADLAESQRVLTARLGHPVTALVWPYGIHNDMARGLADQDGFHTTLALGWRDAEPRDFELHCLPRIMVTRDLRFAGASLSWLRQPQGTMRAAAVSLDDLYDPDMTVCRARLDAMIVRLRAIGATHVLLDVCSNPAADGRLEQVYMPGSQAPMRADLWTLVAAKLANAKLRVWVRAPSMNLTWAWQRHPEWRLGADPHPIANSSFGESADELEARTLKRWPTRLSPELPAVRQAAADFFTDMAVYLPIDGVLFDDDAVLLPGERLASRPVATPAERAQAVDGLITGIEAAVRAWRPECRFGRVGGSEGVLSEGASSETAQNFGQMLQSMDRIVVRADAGDPAFARDPQRWVQVVGRRAIERWRADEQVRTATTVKRGIPAAALQRVPPLLLELPIAGHALDGTPYAGRLPALLATARRAGFESFSIGPVTPANESAIPPRVLEAAGR